MSAYDKAHTSMAAAEGGYANDPHDSGGETIFGITRRDHRYWHGWRIVDGLKRTSRDLFPRIAEESMELQDLAKRLYKARYWDTLSLDRVAEINEQVALEVFDAGVNHGPGRATEFLQRALNLGNERGRYWSNIAVDGGLGPITRRTLHEAIQKRGERRLMRRLLAVREHFYIEISETEDRVTDDKDERFIDGWLDRLPLEFVPR